MDFYYEQNLTATQQQHYMEYSVWTHSHRGEKLVRRLGLHHVILNHANQPSTSYITCGYARICWINFR